MVDPDHGDQVMGTAGAWGLSFCRALITSMGGTFEVTSSAAEGTTFRVTLTAAGPALGAETRGAHQ